jgi:hypothetical protein
VPWYAKLLIPLLSLLLSLVVVEFAIRVVAPQNTGFYDYGQFTKPSEAPWQQAELVPNTGNPGYTGVSVEINSRALRDREISVPKPADTYRVLTIGDSVTFGYGVELDEIYFKVFEERLNANTGGTRFEVINGGLIAAALEYHYHFLRLADTLEPDLILIGLVLNDIKAYPDYSLDPEQPLRVSSAPGIIRQISAFMRINSHLYQMVYSSVKGILYELGILDANELLGYNFAALKESSAELEFAWEKSFWMLENIISLARDKDYEIALVIFPLEMQLNEAALNNYRRSLGLTLGDSALSGNPQDRLRHFAESQNVPIVDLLPVYRGKPAEKLFLRNKSISADPVHPSVFGHRVAGEAIYRTLSPLINAGNVD